MTVEQTHFRDTDVNDLPHNELLKLEEGLVLGMDVMAQAGEFMMVLDANRLPIEVQVAIRAMRERFEEEMLGYLTFKKGPITCIVPLISNIHDGPGEVAARSGVEEPWNVPGFRATIKPEPVTAHLVELTAMYVDELPLNSILILGSTIDLIQASKSTSHLSTVPEDESEASNDPLKLEDPFAHFLSAALGVQRLRRGTMVEIHEADGKRFLVPWGNADNKFEIAEPNSTPLVVTCLP